VVIGADTGFFVKRSERNPRTLQVWENVISGQDHLVISVLTIAEYFAHQIDRGNLTMARELVSQMSDVPTITILPVSLEIASESARFRRGMNLPTVDAIIFATFVSAGCDLMMTTDSIFNQIPVQNLIPVELL
jgi:predicted nucleic acid-binding protein